MNLHKNKDKHKEDHLFLEQKMKGFTKGKTFLLKAEKLYHANKKEKNEA